MPEITTLMGVDQCSSAQLLNELFEKGKESSAALVPNPRKIPPWWAESVMEQVEWTLWIQSIMAIMNAYITHSPPCVRSILRPVVNPETSNVPNAIFRMTKCLLSLSAVKCLAMRLFRWPRWKGEEQRATASWAKESRFSRRASYILMKDHGDKQTPPCLLPETGWWMKDDK